MRDKDIFSEHQARRDTARADDGRLYVYVLRAERIYGRVHAMDKTDSCAVFNRVYADDVIVRGAYDLFGEYAAWTRDNARGERSAEDSATVRTGQLGESKPYERGTRDEHCGQFKQNHRPRGKVITRGCIKGIAPKGEKNAIFIS